MSSPTHRRNPLFFTSEGHLDLTWCFTAAFVFAILAGVAAEALGHPLSAAAWSCIGGAFATALLAAIPINKARILRNATLPGQLAQAIAQAGVKAPGAQDMADAIADKDVDA